MMKNFYRHWLFLLLLGTAASASAQQSISLSQSLDSQVVAYNGKATLEIELTWNGPQSAYRFDRPLQPDLDGLMIGRFETSISSRLVDSAEISTKRFVYSLIPTEPGLARIEPITINYVSWPDSIPGELTTESMTLTVNELEPPDEGGFAYGLVLLGVVLVIALGVVVGVLTFRGRTRKRIDVPGSADEQMLSDIDQLKDSAESDLKRFQTGLYQYLLKYLSAKYDVDLSGKSVQEIDRELERAMVPEDDRNILISWLERAEREKFAPVEGSPGETTRLAAELRQYFEKKKNEQA